MLYVFLILLAIMVLPALKWTINTTHEEQERAWSEGFARARDALGLQTCALTGEHSPRLHEAEGLIDGIRITLRMDMRSSGLEGIEQMIEVRVSREGDAPPGLASLPLMRDNKVDVWLRQPPNGIVLNLWMISVLRAMAAEATLEVIDLWYAGICQLHSLHITREEVIVRFSAFDLSPVDTEAYVIERARQAVGVIARLSWPDGVQPRLLRLWRGARGRDDEALMLEHIGGRLSCKSTRRVWTWLAKHGDGHTLRAATVSLKMPEDPALYEALGARAIDLLDAPGPDALDATQALSKIGVTSALWPRLHAIHERKIHKLSVQLALKDLIAQQHRRRAEDPSAGGLSLAHELDASGGLSVSAETASDGGLSIIAASPDEDSKS